MQKVRHSGIEVKKIGKLMFVFDLTSGGSLPFVIHDYHGDISFGFTHEQARELKNFLDDYFLKSEVVNANT